jgi:hypothetical protein
VPDEKPSVEKAVDLFVYAPVGMALYVRDMLPSMMGIFVSRGKREVLSHVPGRTPPAPTPPPVPPEVKRRIDESVGVAKVVAESGFGVARDVAGAGIGVARDVAGSALKNILDNRPGTTASSTAAGPAATQASNGVVADRDTGSAVPSPAPSPAPSSSPVPTPAPSSPEPETAADLTVPEVDELPIPDYDELSASQVVERLEGLDRESLDAIRAYETEHRGRNTILGKIAQLS